jgi:hypothetical protein
VTIIEAFGIKLFHHPEYAFKPITASFVSLMNLPIPYRI